MSFKIVIPHKFEFSFVFCNSMVLLQNLVLCYLLQRFIFHHFVVIFYLPMNNLDEQNIFD